MPKGQKHLVRCRCVLTQFKRSPDPPIHQFVVFSVIGDDDKVQVRFAQCNNCGVIHKVIDICKSEIVMARDSMTSLITVDDIKPSLPEGLRALLESNHADLATWEAVQFLIANQQWGNFVVVSSDVEEDVRQGKYVRIMGESLYRVESFTRNEVISG